MRPERRSRLLFSLFLLAGLAGVTTVSSQDSQRPVFRSGVDVVHLEVHVLDADGAPVSGIPASSFEVTIDGKRRRVATAEFVRDAAAAAGTPISGAPSARNVWPDQGSAPGRTYVLTFDAATLSAGDGANAATAARGFINQLSPRDTVGIVVLPQGAALTPTLDHDAARRALSSVVGRHSPGANPFHLTPAEVIDLTAALEQAGSVGAAGRAGRAQTSPGQTILQQVQTRECRSGTDASCLAQLVVEVESQARFMEEHVVETFAGLNSLLGYLARYPGRKTVVFFSGGLAVSDRWHSDGGAVRALGRAAALASSTVYAIHLDSGLRSIYNPENRQSRPMVSIGRERDIQQRLLADFAGTSGGALFGTATDAGEKALARVLLETSAVYVLGVAPEQGDLDNRPHELKVKVDRRGVTLRSLQYVVLRSPPTGR